MPILFCILVIWNLLKSLFWQLCWWEILFGWFIKVLWFLNLLPQKSPNLFMTWSRSWNQNTGVMCSDLMNSFDKISFEKISFEKILFKKISFKKISFLSNFNKILKLNLIISYNIFRLNTRPIDTSLGGYFTQSQQGSPIRRVFENNMDEFSFNTMDESILKTINFTHQAYFDLVSTIKENDKFSCKVWKFSIERCLLIFREHSYMTSDVFGVFLITYLPPKSDALLHKPI